MYVIKLSDTGYFHDSGYYGRTPHSPVSKSEATKFATKRAASKIRNTLSKRGYPQAEVVTDL